MSAKPVRWGFVGAGRIAASVSEDLALSDGGVLHAIALAAIEAGTTTKPLCHCDDGVRSAVVSPVRPPMG